MAAGDHDRRLREEWQAGLEVAGIHCRPLQINASVIREAAAAGAAAAVSLEQCIQRYLLPPQSWHGALTRFQ